MTSTPFFPDYSNQEDGLLEEDENMLNMTDLVERRARLEERLNKEQRGLELLRDLIKQQYLQLKKEEILLLRLLGSNTHSVPPPTTTTSTDTLIENAPFFSKQPTPPSKLDDFLETPLTQNGASGSSEGEEEEEEEEGEEEDEELLAEMKKLVAKYSSQ